MPEFAEQLIAARKAKGLTQEKVAQAVHISRSRVSRWETGEAVPDVEMLRKLSEVLEVDFFSGVKGVDDAAPEIPPAETAAPAAVQEETVMSVKSTRKKYWLMAAVAGAFLAVVVLLLVVLPGKQPAAEPHEPYTMAWYQQAQTPVAGQAHVVVASPENPVKAIRFEEFEDGVGWFYAFCCEEVNGVPFTVKKITQSLFNTMGRDDQTFEGEQLENIMGDTTLSKNRAMPFEFCGGFPLQNIKGVGLAVEGVDAKGNGLVFRGYVELSQELAE